MTARLDGDAVVVEGAGIELLRIKAELSATIGAYQVRIIKGVGLAFPASCIAATHQILQRLSPDSRLSERIGVFAAHHRARLEALQILAREDLPDLPGAWSSRLDPHQIVAVAAMTVPGLAGLCLFDEQGSGKTVMAIAAFDILKQAKEIDRLIVLCPKTMIDVWRNDFVRFVGERYKIVSLTDPANPVYPPGFEKFDIYLMNYEGLEKVGLRLGASAEAERTLLAVDESFFLKNPDARRTELASRLRSKCSKGFVLCGTPAPNSFVDVVSQFDLADGGFTFGGSQPASPAGVQRRIEQNGVMIRRLKKDIMPELADKTMIPVLVDLAPRQQDLYRRAKDQLVMYLRTLDNQTVIKKTDSYFRERSALLQICCWPASVDPSCYETPAKLTRLDRLLEDIIVTQGRKVVLWSYYRETIAVLRERYARFKPVVISGETLQEDRRSAVDAFQTDPSVKLFIGNAGAAGAGITLTAASDAVYYSMSSRAADFLQSLDRIHRRGQTAPEINIHVLLSRGTIEENDYQRLLNKEHAQQDLLAEREHETMTVAEALEELRQEDAQ